MSPAGPARVAPGTLRQTGVPVWAFSRLAGRVTRTGPPRIFTTLGRNRRLFWGWLLFAGALMPGGRLPRQDTELMILRVAAVRESPYEFGHHAKLALRVGLSQAEVDRTRLGPTAAGWSARQQLLLRVTDTLLEQRDLDDALWAELRGLLDERTCIEVLMLVGHYDMLATTLNTLRVQPED